MKALFAALLIAGAASSAQAAVPARVILLPGMPITAGQWTVEVTTVTTKAHFNTYRLCLKGDGTWYNTIQVKGSGHWLQSGNTVLWRGNMDGGLNDAAVLTTSDAKTMSGDLMQWIANTSDTTNTAIENVYATTAWTYVGATCDAAF